MKFRKLFAGITVVIMMLSCMDSSLYNTSLLAVTQQENAITITADKEEANYDDQVTLSTSHQADDVKYQWQFSEDSGDSWSDVGGATESTYSFTYSEANSLYSYRLMVIYTGEEAPVYSNSIMISPLLTYEQQAEIYYGENGTLPTAEVEVEYNAKTEEVKAGSNFQLKVSYKLYGAGSYNYGNKPEALFDTYDNTWIDLQLPKGLSAQIESVGDGTLHNVLKAEKIDDEHNIWRFTLKNNMQADSDINGSFLINVKVDDNGKLEVNHSFAFSEIAAPATIHTEFTIKNRTGSIDTDGKTYTKDIETASKPNNLVSVSDDEWIIEKTAGETKKSPDQSTVAVTFELQVGLKDKDTGSILTDEQSYAREGRAPFNNGSLILEELPVVKDREGKAIEAKSISITPLFGDKKEISIDDTSKISLPYEICGNHSALNGVDKDAPYYSTYEVEIVYPYEKFIASYKDENQEKLTVANTAQITYTLKGEDAPVTNKDEASVSIGEVTKPAGLTISKYIVNDTLDTEKPYNQVNFADDGAVTGEAVFTITDEDGKAAVLYEKTADGSYERLKGNTAAISNKDTDGKVTVYLDPGTYTIKETDIPMQTVKITKDENASKNAEDKTVILTAGKTEERNFYNKETLGNIRIEKTGTKNGTTSALAGAEFTLFKDRAGTEEIETVKTDGKGTALFERLSYGTYYVKETSAPAGYQKDTEIYPVTLSSNQQEQKITVDNKYNAAYVQLQKQIYRVSTAQYVNVDQTNYTDFEKAFTIEKSVDGNNWETAADVNSIALKDLSLDQNGIILKQLPVYDQNGKLIHYRFKEILPENWHAAGEQEDTSGKLIVYSEMFMLEDSLGNAQSEPQKITMKNERNGSIALTKEFYKASTSGMTITTDANLKAEFTLYRKVNGGAEYTEYKTYEVSAGKTIAINDLPKKPDSGDDAYYEYYLAETTENSGYELSSTMEAAGTSAKKTTIPVGGKSVSAYGPFIFAKTDETAEVTLQQTITLRNVEQKVPVLVRKANSYTNAFVAGAKVSVYDVTDGLDTPLDQAISGLEGIEINDGGTLLTLEPGKKYLIEETTIPKGYADVTEEKERIVDLTDITSVETNTRLRTVTIKNQPDPSVKITKTRKNAIGSATALNGVMFEVYTKNSEGEFEAVTDDGGSVVTLISGTAKQLKEGTYYLKEIVDEENKNEILAPEKYFAIYKDKATQDENGNVYFGPVEVEQKQAVNTYSIENYSDKGAVTVEKKELTSDGTTASLKGAEIGIYQKEALIAEATSDENGKVTFQGLPIYDEEGNKITYTIKELKAPEGYTMSEEELGVQLEAGKTVTTGTDNEALELVNVPVTSLTVTKYYYNIWEYPFTNMMYELPGTVIALYKLNGEQYELVELQTANTMGTVTFENLAQKDEYVAVEVCIPEEEAYRYLEPEDGKAYLDRDYNNKEEELPETITKDEIDTYNFVRKEANKGNPVGAQFKELINVENWTQLHIEKYVTEESGHEGVTEGEKRVINNAEFELYMQEVDPDKDTELTFKEEDCTLIGTYSSGTLYDQSGKRQDGWFATDILKSADNLVYWLKETKPGIGAEIDPATAITLIKREGTEYTNNSMYGETKSDKVMNYQDNQVTKGSVENKPLYGGGGAMFSTVRIAKWAGSYNEDGEKNETHTPLGNAVFNLYLADKDGNLYTKLDTMTTGLDNDLSATDQKEEGQGELSAWASSRAFAWTDFREEIIGKLDEKVQDEVYETDERGNVYVYAAIVEQGAPARFQPDDTVYYLKMYFQNEEEKTTEIFNDAYYVTEDDPEIEDAKTNADQFALYPTVETAPGEYKPIEDVEIDAQARLVNWPIDNFAVSVKKYGYQYTEANHGLTEDALDEYYDAGVAGRTPLGNVTMRLERYEASSKTWSAYNYDEGHADGIFTTDAEGNYTFPNGLKVGRYRIIETAESTSYDNIYNGADLKGSSEIQDKAAYYFNVMADNVDIHMYNPQKQTIPLMKTNMAATPLAGVTFTLKDTNGNERTARTDETGSAVLNNIATGTWKLTETETPAYSSAYFTKYMQAAYPDLKDMISGDGIFLGYTTEQSQNEDGKAGIKVTKRTTLQTYIKDSTLTVKNPEKVSFTIQKQDKDTKQFLAGAQFKVEYKAFPEIRGEIAVDDTGWTTLGTYTTDATGSYTVNGQKPGIYKVTEAKAPSGYDMDSEPQYLALCGGLNIEKVSVGDEEITTDGDAVLTYQDAKQVSLHIEKTIEKGELTISGTHSFDVSLYDSSKKLLKTETISTVNGGTGTQTFTGLSQGKTYYLKETTPGKGFCFVSLSDAEGKTIEPDKDGYHELTVPETNQDIEVTLTNQYLYAEAVILKVDGEAGTGLSGADFVIKRVEDGKETPLTDVTFKEQENGAYSARVPLTKNEAQTFRIYETKAPVDYLENKQQYIEITLEPGEKQEAPTWHDSYKKDDEAMLENRIMPNYKGAYVDLIKYGNVKETNPTATLANVSFNLYSKTENGAWIPASTAATDKEGKIHFVISGGQAYALAEPTIPSGYKELQGIWDANDQKVRTETATINGNQYTLYILNDGENLTAGQTYRYQAYNTPYMDLEVRKKNALSSQGESIPTATVSLYEIDNKEAASLTAEAVEKIIETKTPLKEGVEVNEKYNGYSSATIKDVVAAGRSYLIVETDSSISQLRDNKQVVWYKAVTIAEAALKTEPVILENVEGSADLALSKKADRTSCESLLNSGQELSFTITPTVKDNTYPLTGFSIEDQRLTAYHENEELSYDNYLKGAYSYTSVTVGKSSHVTENYMTSASVPAIYAKVTFLDSDGKEIYTSDEMNVSKKDQAAMLPAEKGKAAGYRIDYVSEELKKETGYALGQSFTPGSISAMVQIDKQKGGADVKSITKLTNTANAELSYVPWKTNGTKDVEKTLKRSASASVAFSEQKAAIVSVTKETESINVNLGETIEYTITIKNDKNAQAALRNPFIVDILPQGTTLVRQEDAEGKETVVSCEKLPKGMRLSQGTVTTYEGEKAVFAYFGGELQPGEEMILKLKVCAEEEVTSYGVQMKNYVLVGSEERGVESTDNPQVASFKNKNGSWAESAETVLNGIGFNEERMDKLDELLGKQSGYGYVAAQENVGWLASTETTLVKMAYGDRNSSDGYTKDILSTISNGGSMHYRLSVGNLTSAEGICDISLIDILPADGDYRLVGDKRGSTWSLNFKKLEQAYILDADGTTDKKLTEKDYRLYYYTKEIPSDANAYKTVYNDVKEIKYNSRELPDGWTAELPKDTSQVRAFVFAGNPETVKFTDGQTLVVEYEANSDMFDAGELGENAYNTATNTFATHFSKYDPSDPQEEPKPEDDVKNSNMVSNTILPETVEVGGRLWIDKNNNHYRDEGETIDSFKDHRLIQQMLEEVEIQLNKFNDESEIASDEVVFVKGDNWKEDGTYLFDDLDPADLRENLSEDKLYDNGKLVVSALKGENPATYQISVTLPEEEITGSFKVTTSMGSGKSQHPDAIPEKEQIDSNFTEAQITNLSERFFLWAGDDYDHTKDIGLVLYRNLTLHKAAQDDPTEPVEGAEFKIYGPFDPKLDSSRYELTDENLVDVITTDSKGDAEVNGLLWFQNYVIVESKAADGYVLDNAEAKADDAYSTLSKLEGKDNAWVLGVPNDEKASSEESITITNERRASVNFEAEKRLENKRLETDEFTFILTDADEKVLQTVKNKKDGSICFDSVTLHGEGSFTYFIKEKKEAKGGIRYDETIYRLSVSTAWDDVKKALVTSTAIEAKAADGIWKPAEKVSFTNSYQASGALELNAEKTVNNQVPQADEAGKFRFVLTDTTGGKHVILDTASNRADGTIAFAPIKYTVSDAGKSFTYTVKEDSVVSAGYTVDPAVYTIKASVSDNGDGTLKIDKTISRGNETVHEMSFDNTYAASGTWTPEAYKLMDGRDMQTDESFSFTVKENEKIVSTGSISGVKDGKKEDVSFTPITYSLKDCGTHTYVIEETKTNKNGITSDAKKYSVTVTITDKRDGTLDIVSAYDSGVPTFINTYQAEEIGYAPKVNKTMSGEEMTDAHTFHFALKADKDYGKAVVLPKNADDLSMVLAPAEGNKTPSQSADFGEITFTEAGTYLFTITETKGSDIGMIYDGSQWRLEVTAADDLKGRLYIAGAKYYRKDDADTVKDRADFTNEYKPKSTTAELLVGKTVKGNELPSAQAFTFRIKTDAKEGVVMPKDTTAAISISQSNAEAKTTAFDKITFTKAGTYIFLIEEEKPASIPDGYQYTETMWRASVAVSDHDGKLAVDGIRYYVTNSESGNEQAAVFINRYQPKEAAFTPNITKAISGEPLVKDQTFTFVLEADKNNPQGASLSGSDTKETTVTVGEHTAIPADSLKASFDEITFTKAGEYDFTLYEKQEKAAGFSYDKTVWTLHVTVRDESGHLKASGKYMAKDKESSTTNASFHNRYEPGEAGFAAGVEKLLTGFEPAAARTFTFVLVPSKENIADGAILPDGKDTLTAAVKKEGSAVFDKITFRKAGTYAFTIYEEAEDEAYGYTFDETEWTLIVKVSDEGGQLKVDSYSYDSGEKHADDAAQFINSYRPDSVSIAPHVIKKMSGNEMSKAQSFTFELKPAKEYGEELELPADTQGYVQLGADGGSEQVSFEEITFHQEGIYTFLLSEKKEDAAGYHYDETAWLWSVTVKDVGGRLQITKERYQCGEEVSESRAVFVNRYTVEQTGYAPLVEKRINGAEAPEEKEFTFRLSAKEGTEHVILPKNLTAIIRGEGMVSFDELRFTEAGDYEFEIREDKGEENGYTYDEQVWTLHVTVEDRDAKLTVTDVRYTAENQYSKEAAVFTNTYALTPVEHILKAEKKVVGEHASSKDSFMFILEQKEATDGVILPEDMSAAIEGEGIAEFQKLTFTKAGSYTFLLREKDLQQKGYEYDDSCWTVTIEVADKDSRLYVRSVSYIKNGSEQRSGKAVFINTYTKEKVTPSKPNTAAPTISKDPSAEEIKESSKEKDVPSTGEASAAAGYGAAALGAGAVVLLALMRKRNKKSKS